MKRFLILTFLTIICLASCNENINEAEFNPSPAGNKLINPPLNDLEANYWRSYRGGLYPNGVNTRPINHNNAGVQLAMEVKPLDASGNYDPVNGKIVWLSVGMSNTTQETQAFIPMAETLSNRNSYLVLVDGAQGNWDIDMINNPEAAFWLNINTRLLEKGLTSYQVQAIWFKQADRNFPDTSFAGYLSNFKSKLKTSLVLLREKFPNAKLCYLSSRIYGGYQTGIGSNPEPFAYYTGWAVKSLIEDQINGSPDLAYSGSGARVPWLSWGPYIWANGAEARQDGLKWIWPDDYQPDGIHPSITGRRKVAEKLLQFFSADPTSTPWFLN